MALKCKWLKYGLLLLWLTGVPLCAQVRDTVDVSGQLSSWATFGTRKPVSLWAGLRYIPTLAYGVVPREGTIIDSEVSVHLNGFSQIAPWENRSFDSSLKTYRMWVRYSTPQLEVRAGLQKINFGSAVMLRPLMWFDTLDPRDPLQLTSGVWGVLGRYYFLNNANVWLWMLHGNEEAKMWEVGNTAQTVPELGGRLQFPVARSEAAMTYHFRKVVGDDDILLFSGKNIAEHRFGIDAKWDVEVGLWLEATWIQKQENIGSLTNQHMVTLGADYTFGVGNGLNLTGEHLMVSNGESAFEMNESAHITGLSLSYPLGMFSNLSVMVYADWRQSQSYQFLNFKRTFSKIAVHAMAYHNPASNNLPLQNKQSNLPGGTGFQLMAVFNH
jgi:hypothetical protein